MTQRVNTRLMPAELLARTYRRALLAASRRNELGYGDPRGSLVLRQAVAGLLVAFTGQCLHAHVHAVQARDQRLHLGGREVGHRRAQRGAEPRVIVRRGRMSMAWSRGGWGWSARRSGRLADERVERGRLGDRVAERREALDHASREAGFDPVKERLGSFFTATRLTKA